MQKTKVFRSGNSLAVRLPKEFQMEVGNVLIFKKDEDIVIRKMPSNLAGAFTILTQMPDDFMAEGREDTPPQKRDF